MPSFTSTLTILATLLAATTTTAIPLDISPRASVCGQTPSGTGSQSAIATPTATTAEQCQADCEANASCLSFAFGLPPNADDPVCQLFSVAASQVPAQQTNVEVFDVACSDVPTTAPTTANPVGTTGSASGSSGSGSGSDSQNQNQNQNQGSNQGSAQGQGQGQAQ
ncbi:hypothetical protein F5Y15DRAFT_414504 [Xylariaceae sp. FL0016]|nr:hypothetical protein F5Y15DRAFT_414504 [Xylariaceae sp. FL0016]